MSAEGRYRPAGKTPKIVGGELDLHALTVDEAIPVVREYSSDGHMVGMTDVRIVHGKGTGTLRQAVIRELKNHPLVRSYRTGSRFEGSTGATVVQLR